MIAAAEESAIGLDNTSAWDLIHCCFVFSRSLIARDFAMTSICTASLYASHRAVSDFSIRPQPLNAERRINAEAAAGTESFRVMRLVGFMCPLLGSPSV